jgi:hemerythrin-like domain-containing protein
VVIELNPVEILSMEHKYILLTAESLARSVDSGIRMKRLNFIRTEEMINFFRFFADKWHHCKEKDTLFQLICAEKLRGDKGYDFINDLVSEHIKARLFINGMDNSYRDAAHGDMKKLI